MGELSSLQQRDVRQSKRIAIIGDALIDEWIHGTLTGCQDGCPKFVETHTVRTPGGAANAARCLQHWNAEAWLISPISHDFYGLHFTDGVRREFCFRTPTMPVKRRYLDGDKIVFRHDEEYRQHGYGLSELDLKEFQEAAFKTIAGFGKHIGATFDAVLISDYDKGWLYPHTIRKVIDLCNERQIPVVADAKRVGDVYRHACIKGNADYFDKVENLDFSLVQAQSAGLVVTRGHESPLVYDTAKAFPGARSLAKPSSPPSLSPVACKNHVGAGDCFAAHLVLALAHGLSLEDAATVAHSAGRVYVQHLHSRPPYPFEIKKDGDPVGGKVLDGNSAAALRRSNVGRIVFANGVFRIPHAGHAWLLNWAKQQGDVLVVGVNDDASAAKLRPGEFCLPLQERCEILAGLSCVDWVIPFAEPDPCGIIEKLQPDCLTKGNEYAGELIPGADLVPEVRLAPESPYASHCRDLVKAVRGG